MVLYVYTVYTYILYVLDTNIHVFKHIHARCLQKYRVILPMINLPLIAYRTPSLPYQYVYIKRSIYGLSRIKKVFMYC